MTTVHFEWSHGRLSRWKHAGPFLVDGWPWGWGALHAGFREGEGRDWLCVGCRRKQRANAAGPLWFPAGTFSLLSIGDEPVCPDCARARCTATFDRCHLVMEVRQV